ncbi:hypothetical protein ATN84_24220 [Paramesorhizobium deserti]|uniref:LysM domain-containing protein n=1 Tax=Paramesorhizobium deserti TaxID=1494590 RepID=A0A135HY13_9HYPH|nr:Ig-like domain-containing protein [Paramesorhizobium deserti]KXF78069.1 hypothetical protein ATN84_24220 [Paramesorhizobium deserti]
MQKNHYALLGFAAVIAAAGIASYFGVLPGPTPEAPREPPAAAAVAPAKPPVDAPQAEAPAPEAAPPADQRAGVTVPSFDILRVEPDGSVVIAGKAAPSSNVDVVAGSTVLGSARAAENGDFAVALDRALKPGDHQLVLRATGTDNKAATSEQTAVVSVPDKESGQVLALVEQPGQASRMITTPQAQKPVSAEPADAKQDKPLPPSASSDAQPETTQKPADQALATPGQNPAAATPEPAAEPQQEAPIAVEAVEIEGNTIFVAGRATKGKRVAVYANDTMLGSDGVSPAGRFLVQSQHPLAVGDYIIRADLTEKDGTVIASARVPFRREAGENISAVAPKAGGDAAGTQADQPASSGSAMGAASDATAKPLKNVAGSVIIRKGDNLWTISKRTYGRGTRYTTIYLANADQIKNPDLIWPGQVFSMPNEPLSDEEVQHRLKTSQ